MIGSGAKANPPETSRNVTDSGAGKLCNPVPSFTETKCWPAKNILRDSFGDFGSIQILRGVSGNASWRFQVSPVSCETKRAEWLLSPAAYRTLEFSGSIAIALIRPTGSESVTRVSSEWSDHHDRLNLRWLWVNQLPGF